MQPRGMSTGCVDVALGLSPADTCALGSTCVCFDPTGFWGSRGVGIWGAGRDQVINLVYGTASQSADC